MSFQYPDTSSSSSFSSSSAAADAVATASYAAFIYVCGKQFQNKVVHIRSVPIFLELRSWAFWPEPFSTERIITDTV
jgi:hypothetical protein